MAKPSGMWFTGCPLTYDSGYINMSLCACTEATPRQYLISKCPQLSTFSSCPAKHHDTQKLQVKRFLQRK